jgi:FkbM family methyltransferase
MAEEIVIRYPTVSWKAPADYRLTNVGPNRIVAARQGFTIYNKYDKIVGQSIEQYGEYSEGVSTILRQLLRPGWTVVEAGANMGIHTMVLAKLVGPTGTVYAFEPQRPIFQILCGNMAINGILNVHCRSEALGQEADTVVMPRINYAADNTFAGLNLEGHKDGERIPVVTIDSLQLTRCDFIKADVEGMELAVLKGAAETIKKYHPVVYVKNYRREKSAALIEHLQSLDYQLYWHMPLLYNGDNFFQNSTNILADMRAINMLGVHSSMKTVLRGFPPVKGPGSMPGQ